MTKALLIGSAPCLLEQLRCLSAADYAVVAVINDWTNDTTRQLLAAHSLQPNYYFFSDWFYFDEARGEEVDALPQKKIMCVPWGHRVNCRRLRPRPHQASVTEWLLARGISVNSRDVARRLSECGGYSRGMWPSTGLLALGHLVLEEGLSEVDLVGFSFFQGKTHYYDDIDFDRKRHCPKAEVRIYEYFAQGRAEAQVTSLCPSTMSSVAASSE